MRVFILTFDNYPAGGVQRSATVIRQYLSGVGHEVEHRCLRPHPIESHQREVQPVLNWPTDRSMSLLQWWRLVRALRHAVATGEPDVCIGMDWTPTIFLAFATLGVRQRLIGSERSYPGGYHLAPVWRALRSLALARLDKLVCQTQRTADWYAHHKGLPSSRITVIPNSFPSPASLDAQPPATLANLDDCEVIACIGRMAPEKGHADALAIFARVAEFRPKARLLLVGDGPLRRQLEQEVRHSELAGRVVFHRSISPLDALWPIVDLFLLSSRYEGMPNTLGEAMACGIACVAFDCPTGPAEMIRNGIDGYLVPPGDIEAAAERCLRLLADKALRRQIGHTARELPTRFAPDCIGRLWAELVERSSSRLAGEAGQQTGRTRGA